MLPSSGRLAGPIETTLVPLLALSAASTSKLYNGPPSIITMSKIQKLNRQIGRKVCALVTKRIIHAASEVRPGLTRLPCKPDSLEDRYFPRLRFSIRVSATASIAIQEPTLNAACIFSLLALESPSNLTSA